MADQPGQPLDDARVTLSGVWGKVAAVVGVASALLIAGTIATILVSAFRLDLRAWMEQDNVKVMVALLMIVGAMGHVTAFVLGLMFRRSWHGKLAMASPLITLALYLIIGMVARSMWRTAQVGGL